VLLALLGLVGVIAPPTPATAPPVASGCGDDGPTMSASRPTMTLPRTLTLRSTGRVRIVLTSASQTAAATVKLAQAGGRRVGGTAPGTHTCTNGARASSTVSVPLDAYGRRLVRRHGHLRVRVTLNLVNGSDVTNRVRGLAVIRPSSGRRGA
jgi:hypothetical protein